MTDTAQIDQESGADGQHTLRVFQAGTLVEAHEAGLVLLAAGLACWVHPVEHGYQVAVESSSESIARSELAAYASELASTPKPRPQETAFRHGPGLAWILVWVALEANCFWMQQRDPSLSERFASSSIALIEQHQWWRPLTALFLHADASHLVGNLVSGSIFASLLSRQTGAWTAWVMILFCGAAGNAFTSALTYPEAFVSIGASTAVFAALGLLAGHGFVSAIGERLTRPGLRTVAPVLAALVILGWFGGGTPEGDTDVLGHVLGFLSGLVAGMAQGFLIHKQQASD